MIDWVILDRLKYALAHGTPFDSDEIPERHQVFYYRELVYMGFTPGAIALKCGWNAKRIQQRLLERGERYVTPPSNLMPEYLTADDIRVDHRPGAIILTINRKPYIVEDTPTNLLALGRLTYSAASDQPEEKSA